MPGSCPGWEDGGSGTLPSRTIFESPVEGSHLQKRDAPADLGDHGGDLEDVVIVLVPAAVGERGELDVVLVEADGRHVLAALALQLLLHLAGGGGNTTSRRALSPIDAGLPYRGWQALAYPPRTISCASSRVQVWLWG
jgi:hypothetical protein